MKKSILFILLIGMTLLNSCETQEIVLTEQNNSNPIYNSVISSYLTNFKTSVSKNKENTKKISALMQAIDYNTIKQYDLKNTIKLVVIDLKNFSVSSEVDQTKAIFFVLNNSIIRSNIVTIKNKLPFENPDQVIVSIFDKKENKDNYSGKIEFYNLFQNILLSDEFENGKLTVNGIARIDAQKSLTAKCTAWYWVTTYASGRQTAEYMFTTCDCEEDTYRTECGGGGGGSDSSTNNIPGRPNYPSNPKDTNLFTYIDWDGELVTKKFNEEIGIWELVSISLSEVTIRNNPKKYDFLLFAWPQDLQKILNNNIIYTYDGASGSWEGEPATEESIAQAIEDQIDDSKLDPCPKAIMDQLKNSTNNDITKILTKLGANSVYTLDMVMGPTKQGYAQTQKISQNNYVITVANDRYTNSTQLFRAASLVHEIIHTYYLSVVDDNNSPSTNLSLNNFSALYQAYEQKKYPGGVTVAQHDQMAKDYVDSMALALQEYYLNNNTTPYSIPSYEVFSDLAWGTLQEASIFQEKFKDGDPAKERILNRYSCESNGQSIATGTPKQQNPIGKPCN